MSQSKTLSRAAAIVIHDNQLLVIYRKKNTTEYYTFPGGTIEDYESTEAAVARETFEETSILVNVGQFLYQLDIISDVLTKREYFYICNYLSGTPNLQSNSVEFLKMNLNNVYQPIWLPIDQLSKTRLYPLEIRDLLIVDLKKGFRQEPHYLVISKEQMRNT